MPLLEAIIIYLSAGAPFGVLVFFSRRSGLPAPMAMITALMATAGWPIVGAHRLYRGLSRRRTQHLPVNSIPVLTDVLRRLANETPSEPAELFEIAGHSNPWLATNCYARSRKKVIDSHIGRSSELPEPSYLSSAHLPETLDTPAYSSALNS